jgi:four helix bundle protein
MPFKFEMLEVWRLSLEYIDLIYDIARKLPKHEEYNLGSQITRAATSVALNIAEGSTGQTDAEQARFLGLAIRSVIETVACQHIISRRDYFQDLTELRQAYNDADQLVAKLQKMRTTILPKSSWIREEPNDYKIDGQHGTNDDYLTEDAEMPF